MLDIECLKVISFSYKDYIVCFICIIVAEGLSFTQSQAEILTTPCFKSRHFIQVYGQPI